MLNVERKSFLERTNVKDSEVCGFGDVENFERFDERNLSHFDGEKFARDFGLRDQIRRATVSIRSNVAESFERDGDKEFVQFLFIAKASCDEVRSQLYVAFDQNYISESDFNLLYAKAIENSRVISGLIKYLKQAELTGKKYK